MTSLSKLRAAIIEAVPELMEYTEQRDTYNAFGEWDGVEQHGVMRPITLAGVLRAVKVAGKNIGVSNRGKFMRQIEGTEVWEEMETPFDLAKNLDDQSPETIDFLTSVLCK